MYGFLKMPRRASPLEKEEYGKYMCALCDSLHKSYGIRGRLFVNYDCTTLALLMGSLDESIKDKVMSGPKRKRLSCFLKPKKSLPEVFKFVSAVSMMLGYSKFLDKSIDEGKRIPKWVAKLADSASDYLLVYGLDKSFFESKLQEQHKLEKEECSSIEVLGGITSEITSKIFEAAGEVANKPERCIKLRELGFEVGRMIYIYDGLLDYHQDLRKGSFNCIRTCYFRDNFNRKESIAIEQASEEISNFLKITKYNISAILDEIELKNSPLLRKIFLQEVEKGQTRYKVCSESDLLQQKVYAILAGGLAFPVMAVSKDPPYPDEYCDEWSCCCWIPCCWNLCVHIWNDMIMREFHDRGFLSGVCAILTCFGGGCCCLYGLCGYCSEEGCGGCGECCCGEKGIPVRRPRPGCCGPRPESCE